MRKIKMLFVTGLFLLWMTPVYAAQETGQTVVKRGVETDDYYAVGGNVNIDADLLGDALIIGGELDIRGTVDKDLFAVGGTIKLSSNISDDARVAGGRVEIDSRIGDDLFVSGGDVRLSSATYVDGDAWIAGGNVVVDATVAGDLRVGAGDLQLSGTVLGDVLVEAGTVELLDGSVIEGDLVYSSPEPGAIHEKVLIHGKTEYSKADWQPDYQGNSVFFVITMLVASAVFYRLFPQTIQASAAFISSDPWPCLWKGFVFLFITPILAVLLMAIVLGLWVGLVMLALYFITLLLGYLVAVFFIGSWLAEKLNWDISSYGKRVLSALAGIVLLVLLSYLPLVGGLIGFLALLIGVGAMITQARKFYSA